MLHWCRCLISFCLHRFDFLPLEILPIKLLSPALQHWKYLSLLKIHLIQECIPVGCVPPAHWPYLIASAPPQTCHVCSPTCHACPPATRTSPLPHPPPSTMHAQPLPYTLPCHACPPCHAHPPLCMPPLWTDRHLWKHNLRKLRLWAVIRPISKENPFSLTVNRPQEVT